MPRALCMVREQPNYRRDAFLAGLACAGYHVMGNEASIRSPGPDDILVIWNRYATGAALAQRFDAAGARVIVAENGYAGSDAEGRQLYAITQSAPAGVAGFAPSHGDRWTKRGITLQPWRPDPAGHVLICPQRGFTVPPWGMPKGWPERTLAMLTAAGIPARIRPHPGNVDRATAVAGLLSDMEGARAVVIWASTAGVHSLINGIPVFHDAPHWVGEAAARRFSVAALADPFLDDRTPAFRALAWCQWEVAEIETGAPFRHLAPCARAAA